MTGAKRERYLPTRVPMAEVLEELGDPNRWDADDEEYRARITAPGPVALPQAAKASERRQRIAPKTKSNKGRSVVGTGRTSSTAGFTIKGSASRRATTTTVEGDPTRSPRTRRKKQKKKKA